MEGNATWEELIYEDFPEMGRVTNKTLETIKREGYRFRGGVRISTGRIWIDGEYEDRRKKVLSEPLP